MSIMWDGACETKLIEDIYVGSNNVHISHLLFADHTLLFSAAKPVKCLNLKIMLYLLQAVTGTKINMRKSELIGVNIQNDRKTVIQSNFSVQWYFPINYLGYHFQIEVLQGRVGRELSGRWKIDFKVERKITHSWR